MAPTGQIAIVATLRPGMEEEARRLIGGGPPFDPTERGFGRHTIFLSANEVVFVFEAAEVEWRLDDLVDDPFEHLTQEAMRAWGEIVDGPPRIARVVYEWGAEQAPAETPRPRH